MVLGGDLCPVINQVPDNLDVTLQAGPVQRRRTCLGFGGWTCLKLCLQFRVQGLGVDVAPSESRAETFAPCAIKSFTTSRFPRYDADRKGVDCLGPPVASTSASPASINCCTFSVRPSHDAVHSSGPRKGHTVAIQGWPGDLQAKHSSGLWMKLG